MARLRYIYFQYNLEGRPHRWTLLARMNRSGINYIIVKSTDNFLLSQKACVMTCASRSGSGMWQNPTGDNQVSRVHECGSRAKEASSTTVLAHQFPPPSLSGG